MNSRVERHHALDLILAEALKEHPTWQPSTLSVLELMTWHNDKMKAEGLTPPPLPVIKYVKGDATQPQGEGPKFIAHICNNDGGWGAGFTGALSRRWKEPELHYRTLYIRNLGDTWFVTVDEKAGLTVANMIAQKGYRRPGNLIPLGYAALEECLFRLAQAARTSKASVHMPRIGSGLGGGDWNVIEKIIEKTLIAGGVSVTVYELV